MEVELHGALSVVNVPKCLCFTGLLAKHCNFLARIEPSKYYWKSLPNSSIFSWFLTKSPLSKRGDRFQLHKQDGADFWWFHTGEFALKSKTTPSGQQWTHIGNMFVSLASSKCFKDSLNCVDSAGICRCKNLKHNTKMTQADCYKVLLYFYCTLLWAQSTCCWLVSSFRPLRAAVHLLQMRCA